MRFIGGKGIAAQGVRAERIQAINLASSERTKLWYIEPGVSFFLNCSRQSYDKCQFVVLGDGTEGVAGSVKIALYRPSRSNRWRDARGLLPVHRKHM